MYYHFSEDPSIICFHPRPHPSHPSLAPVVWAIDQEKSPLYFFPRDCPQIGFGRSAKTTPEDAARFMGYSDASMIIAAESAWYQRIKEAKLYKYTFPPTPLFAGIMGPAIMFATRQLRLYPWSQWAICWTA